MPMPGLILSEPMTPGKSVDNQVEKKMVKTKKGTIGSFRNNLDIKTLLPPDLHSDIFDPIPDNLDVGSLITIPESHGRHYLNNAAFGRAYDDVLSLSNKLRNFAETNPDTFYDQACLPLVDYTYQVLENFFGTDQMVLVPNCTLGLRSVMERLVKSGDHRVMAQLSPIYGATQKLMEYYRVNGIIDKVTVVIMKCSDVNEFLQVLKISPGRGHSELLEEDPHVIFEALEDAFAMQEFSVLFCDQVASQTGRILPLEPVIRFCRENKIVLVVDGTQSCQQFFGKNKQHILNCDYFVLSTHKWISNVKELFIMNVIATTI